MEKNTTEKGRDGEELAVRFLEEAGLEILERNYRFGKKEIDLIAMDRDELVIVEVKSRRYPMLESPEQIIDREKRRSLIIAANAYTRYHRIRKEVRFDVIFILRWKNEVSIQHIRRAFYPTL